MEMYVVGFIAALALAGAVAASDGQPLPGTKPLDVQGDLAAQMVAGIERFFMREIESSTTGRAARWNRDFSSPESYVRSIEPNRERFRSIIGLADRREPPEMRLDAALPATGPSDHRIGEGAGYRIYAVRWSVLPGVEGEGLLLQPVRRPVADVVALPDCDRTPEMLAGLAPGVPAGSQFARALAENGCRVLIPFLMDRQDTWSGIPGVGMTNQPHREFLWRAAYEMGRHIIGYEVQKVLAAVDWFAASQIQNPKSSQESRRAGVGSTHAVIQNRPVGVIGYGEGGLIAFYAAAADTRIDAAAVCGYFGPREALWREPIYRNVFGLLAEFGDAEIASLIAPRALIVEACGQPEIAGPPPPSPGRGGAAPGVLTTPPVQAVEAEVERARKLTAGMKPPFPLMLVQSGSDDVPPGSEAALSAFLKALGVKGSPHPRPLSLLPRFAGGRGGEGARLKRQFEQILQHTQRLMRESPAARAAFWSKADASSVEKWQESARQYRDCFWDEVIGRLPAATFPANPRSRLVCDTPKFRGYEVVLDVYPDVFAYGILLLPKDIREGERRPVVVCQHGLEGRPQDVADPQKDDPAYHQYACKLAERGFVTFAPQNPYIGGDSFRVLVRKAQPLKQTLFAVIVRQHERILEWLSAQPFTDPDRIAFYGLSYGGKTAMRVPALLERYCLSICSADYNEWIWKNVSASSRYSYLLTNEYDMPEWNLGNTFNYAEMSWLIFPRPFMVERGHEDGVAPDEWVAYEYARTRRRYDMLGLGDRTEMEVFNGPHTIHGVGTFDFLHRHLRWPKR
jgi:dienelactone hydrolase